MVEAAEMMVGSGKAGDSLVDFMDGGDGDGIGDSDEEGTAGPGGRAAVKLEEKQGAQQMSGAGAALSRCCPCRSCSLGRITGYPKLGCCPAEGAAGFTAGAGRRWRHFGVSVDLHAARQTGQPETAAALQEHTKL